MIRRMLAIAALSLAPFTAFAQEHTWPPSGDPPGTPGQVAWDMLPGLERGLGPDVQLGNLYSVYGSYVEVTVNSEPVYVIRDHPRYGMGIVHYVADEYMMTLGDACFEEASGIDL